MNSRNDANACGRTISRHTECPVSSNTTRRLHGAGIAAAISRAASAGHHRITGRPPSRAREASDCREALQGVEGAAARRCSEVEAASSRSEARRERPRPDPARAQSRRTAARTTRFESVRSVVSSGSSHSARATSRRLGAARRVRSCADDDARRSRRCDCAAANTTLAGWSGVPREVALRHDSRRTIARARSASRCRAQVG